MITPAFSLTATERVLPKLALDFTTASLDSRVTFTRTTGASNPATYTNSSGVITVATNNQPRFDYDPVTLACKGLLIEEARTNRCLYSTSFGTNWNLTRANINLNSQTSPDGTQNAAKLFSDNTASASHLYFTGDIGGLASATVHTISIYAKKAEWNTVGIYAAYSGSGAIFNLDTVAYTGPINTAPISTSITAVGNGWYRCSFSYATTGTSERLSVYVGNNGATSVSGDGVSGIYIWGAQLEAGAFATSYIPTTTTALTRNADVATMTGTNFSDWFNASEGTFRVDARTPASGTRSLISADDNTSGNSIVMPTVGTAPKLIVTQSSAEQANVAAGTITANTAMFAYASYASNYFGIARPSARQVDTSGTVPTVDRLRIGTDQAGNYANGIIQAIQYWP